MLLGQAAPPPKAPEYGMPMPDVRFQREDGTWLRLRSLKNKVVALEFSSIHCPPCMVLLPKYEEFRSKVHSKDVVFLTVMTDDPREFAEWRKGKGKTYKTDFLLDPAHDDRSNMAIWQFGNVAVPTLFTFDRKGKAFGYIVQGDDTILPILEGRLKTLHVFE